MLMCTFEETRNYLYALKNRGSKFGIDRMERLVQALGHPELKAPVIHVAGTNGKGSVCAMLEALYRSNGYKTGLFTSPHLVHLGERMQVNRKNLDEAGIVQYVQRLQPVATEVGSQDPDLHPTFFEFVTAMAFLHFLEEGVDLAIIETGLGGRLDATNVVDPELCIITSISFDHMELLGNTLAKIAGEKAGIIKPGKPVLIGCLPDEAEAVIREVAQARGCPIHSVRERFSETNLPETNLSGKFQRWNAALALYACELLKARFPIHSRQALRTIDWPGRWQRIQVGGRTVILDATHNPEGAAVLKENLEHLIASEGRKPVIIAGSLGEVRGRSLMEAIAPYARELHLVEPDQDRATSRQFLEACLPFERAFEVHHAKIEDLFTSDGLGAEATDEGTRRAGTPLDQPGDTIVVTGSIYLIGEVLARLQGNSGSGTDLQDKF